MVHRDKDIKSIDHSTDTDTEPSAPLTNHYLPLAIPFLPHQRNNSILLLLDFY